MSNTEIYLNFVLLSNTRSSIMRIIPNFITSLNLASGFAAVIFAAGGDILTASWLIIASMIFDFFDGFSARLLKSYSAIGKELDSLADVVSFGVAPGIIIWILLRNALSGGNPPAGYVPDPGNFLLIAVAAIMPVCAAFRLAVFNLDETQTKSFKGLPSPANAIAVISLVVAAHYSSSSILSWFTGSPVSLSIFALLLSILMVTRIPLFSLKVSDLRFKGNEGRYIMFLLIIVAFAIFGFAAAPMIIPVYIISSFIQRLF
jgi:CDP-diacylglycerol---serine O-phosphatidyltransferase